MGLLDKLKKRKEKREYRRKTASGAAVSAGFVTKD